MNTVKSWLDFTKSLVAVLIIVGGAVALAGDYRWVTVSSFQVAAAEQAKVLQAVSNDLSLKLAMIQINNLDKQITFLRIKINQGEATQSEKIFIQTLEQQLRQLKSEID